MFLKFLYNFCFFFFYFINKKNLLSIEYKNDCMYIHSPEPIFIYHTAKDGGGILFLGLRFVSTKQC